MKEKIKDTIEKIKTTKKKHSLIFLILTIIICACFPLAIEKFVYNLEPFYIKRFIFFLLFFESIGIIFFFEKKGFEFLYKYRYLIGIIIFILCVCLKINYSSAPILDDKIQPNYNVTENDIIIGKYRAIRTDDYVISITNILSQYHNDFNVINNKLMARDLILNMYPRTVNNNIISLLNNPSNIAYMFMPIENAYSFSKLFLWFVGFFAVFEMLMIISKNKKIISLMGTLLIIFGPVILWFDTVYYIAFVALLYDILYLFINSNNVWKKMLFSVLFGWIGSCFIMWIYPAWQIPYGYLFLVLSISLLIDNKDKIKFSDIFYALISISIAAGLVLPNIVSSYEQYKLITGTLYPGKRNVTGGNGLLHLFYYAGSLIFPIKEVGNACEISGFISLFPIPIILGIIQFIKNIKNKTKDILLFLLLLLELLFLYFDIFGSSLLGKITLLYMVPTGRLAIIIHLICILIMIRLISNYSFNIDNYKKKFVVAIISFISSLIIVYITRRMLNSFISSLYIGNLITAVLVILYFVLFYFLICNNKKSKIGLCVILGLISIFQFLTINPLVIGLDVYLDKPLASEINKISNQDKDAIWISTDSEILQQYALASGAKVLNSVNYFPNYDYWKILDKDRKYDEVYNRYGRVVINLTKNKTSFELFAPDAFKIYLNHNDVCKLGIDYIITETNYDNKDFERVYEEDNTIIYKTNCNK